MPTIPDIDMGETGGSFADSGFDMDSEAADVESSVIEERDDTEDGSGSDDDDSDDEDSEDDDSYFSDKNRWKRGGIVDPDADEW